MRTSELVSYIRKKTSGYTAQEVLALIDHVQEVVYSNTTLQTEYIDPTTGMPPYLATLATQFRYNCPATCRRTIAVFSKDLSGYTNTNYAHDLGSYVFNGAKYYLVLTSSVDALETAVGSVTFVDDPGTTLTTYYHLYVLKPTPLLSDAIQLVIPPKHHLAIVWGVLALIKDDKFGDASAWEYWLTKRMPAIVQDMNGGAQLARHQTPIREEYREYTSNQWDRTRP